MPMIRKANAVRMPATAGIHCCQEQASMAKGHETNWQTRLSTIDMFSMTVILR